MIQKNKKKLKKQKGVFKFPRNANLSADCKDFILKLLTVDVKSRLSSKEAIEHPWIVGMFFIYVCMHKYTQPIYGL